MYEFLDRRYALALFNICEKAGNTKLVLEQLEEVVEYFHSNEGIIKILKNPQINKLNKTRIFKEIFAGNVEKELLDFLLMLIDKDRILHLHEKCDQFKEIYLDSINTVIAKITSAVPMDKSEEDELRKRLEEKYKKTVVLEIQVDETMLGGMIINIEDEVIDGTIRNKLKSLEDIVTGRVNERDFWMRNNPKPEALKAEVTTSVKLSKDEIEKLKDGLNKFYGREIQIEEVIDSSVIDGIKIKIGDDIIDNTLRRNLMKMRKESYDLVNMYIE